MKSPYPPRTLERGVPLAHEPLRQLLRGPTFELPLHGPCLTLNLKPIARSDTCCYPSRHSYGIWLSDVFQRPLAHYFNIQTRRPVRFQW